MLIFFPGRNPDYQRLNLTFATNVLKFATIIGFFPKPLKRCVIFTNIRLSPSLRPEVHTSIVARVLSNLPSQIQQEIEFVRPIVEERFAKMEEFGENWDMPVCDICIHHALVFFSLRRGITERYTHVADERG